MKLNILGWEKNKIKLITIKWRNVLEPLNTSARKNVENYLVSDIIMKKVIWLHSFGNFYVDEDIRRYHSSGESDDKKIVDKRSYNFKNPRGQNTFLFKDVSLDWKIWFFEALKPSFIKQ